MGQINKLPLPFLSRRALLRRAGNGFGAVALSTMLGEVAPAWATAAPKVPHFSPKAKSVIFLFMEGAVSQVDSFDHKPMLDRYHGQNPRQTIGKIEKPQFESIGAVMKSPWAFRQRG